MGSMVLVQNKSQYGALIAAAFFVSLGISPLWANKKSKNKDLAQVVATNPIAREIVYGKKINQITSCAAIDNLGWKFRPDGRQARVLVRDTMRLNSDFEFSSWEVSQVLDVEGYSTFVFRRALTANKTEAYLVRDYLFNRIHETGSYTRIVETRELKHLINRPALVFTTPDNATISLYPGAFKSAFIVISPAQGESGQVFAPVYVKATVCYRPDEALEFLKVGKENSSNELQPGAAVRPSVTPKK